MSSRVGSFHLLNGKKGEPLSKRDVSRAMMPPDGSDLMLRFMGGDDRAFEDLVAMHEHGVLNFFYRLTGERHAAEDMAQDLFLKVFRYRETYEPRASFRSFLYRMARNMWIDRYRKRKTRPQLFPLDANPSDRDRRASGRRNGISSKAPLPHEEVVRKEHIKRLAEAIKGLSEKQREVLALCLEGHLRYAEIGDILQVPVGTIKSRMHAAVARLRELMGEK
jgi:RNA polymerase sigma-70 factor (ECF subfamily)